MSVLVRADMTGTVVAVVAHVGDEVESGDDLVILESMKMEIPVGASVRGVVKELHVSEGDAVREGDAIALLE